MLRRVSALGGPAVTITDLAANLRGASWGTGDIVVYGMQRSGLWRVSARGGVPEQLTVLDPEQGEMGHAWPDILPGSKAVLFTVRAVPSGSSRIESLSLETGERKVIVEGGTFPRYSPTGHLLYVAEGSLRAVPLALDTLEVVGDSVPVLEGVVIKGGGAASFDLSDAGALVYVPAHLATGRALVWVNRDGQQVQSVIENAPVFGMPTLSPDGRRVALAMRGARGIDIWIRDLVRQSSSRVTVEGSNQYPVWTADGTAITFMANRSGSVSLSTKRADGSGDLLPVRRSAGASGAGSWTRDGKTLVYYEVTSNSRDIWSVSVGEDPVPFLVTPFNERAPRLSPDDRWVAYVSDQSGEDRVYAQRFPEGGLVIPVSTGHGTEAVWSRDGRELFYRSGNAMMAVDVETGDELRVGTPRLLFERAFDADPNGIGNPNYDVSQDGRRFLIATTTNTSATATLRFVQHWTSELRRLVPIP